MIRLTALATVMTTAWATHLLAAPPTVHPWEVHEIELTAQEPISNAYVEGLPDDDAPYVVAEVSPLDANGGKTYRIPGFWDGGTTWRVRIALPHEGRWRYRTRSSDAGLDDRRGELRCESWTESELAANPTRRGPVRVCQSGPRPGRYFEYTDGTPMLWLGDTWWNWTKREIEAESFQRLIDDRAAKGFNVGQLFFAASGWGRSSSMLDEDYDEPDLEHVRSVERMIREANARGITVWIHGWWSRPDLATAVGPEKIRRWSRYITHRLAGYNVVWVLAGEYNMWNYGGLGLDFWKGLGATIDAEDPFDRAISAHPTPPGWGGGEAAPQWSTAEVLHDAPWLDYHQSQTGHGQWRNEMAPRIVRAAYALAPAKPIVITEPWYEFVEGNPSAAQVRLAAWSAVLSGAAGHSYGGGHIWRAHLPESPAGGDTWPLEEDFDVNTLDYPGAQSLAFMGRLLRAMPWWRLEPHPELVRSNPSNYCAAIPGEHYVIFLRWGGTVDVDLQHAPDDTNFRVEWIDLTTEKRFERGTTTGGAVRTLHPPASYPGLLQPKDWILSIERTED